MPMFRTKSGVSEARQFCNDGSSYDLLHWINEGQYAIGGDFASWIGDKIIVPTLEGARTAAKGDWIIRGVAGDHYPCKHDIFQMTYEVAEPHQEG